MYFQAAFCQVLMVLDKVMPALITDVIWKNFFLFFPSKSEGA